MALIDSVLNMVTKQKKDPDAPKAPVGSRSEREAKIKDKAGKNYTMQYLLSRVNDQWGVDGAQVSEKLDRINY